MVRDKFLPHPLLYKKFLEQALIPGGSGFAELIAGVCEETASRAGEFDADRRQN